MPMSSLIIMLYIFMNLDMTEILLLWRKTTTNKHTPIGVEVTRPVQAFYITVWGGLWKKWLLTVVASRKGWPRSGVRLD